MSITNFSEYMADLCRRHVDIRHDPAGEIHYVDSGAEKDMTQDSVLCYPAVILERGQYQYTGSEGAMSKEYDYMIFVVDHVSDTGDFDQIRRKRAKCERLLDELFNRILADKRARLYKFLMGFSLPGIEVEPVDNIDNTLYGVMGMFSLSLPYSVMNCTEVFE